MNNNEFEAFFEERVNACRETLVVKAREYAMEGDRLHNFKVAAAFNGTSEEEACWWFASKHLVSLADMVKATSQGEHYVQAIWNEKLGDALNYLFLLDAIVRQDEPRMEVQVYTPEEIAGGKRKKTEGPDICLNPHCTTCQGIL